jgi:hypothetical protein
VMVLQLRTHVGTKLGSHMYTNAHLEVVSIDLNVCIA